MAVRKTIVEDDIDILVVGGGMGGCGAAWEARFWGRDMKIVCVEKANIERSGAVAQGLYAINCYMGMRGARTSPRTMSATRATTSWAWCARTCARHRPARRLHGAQVRGVGPAHHEGPEDRALPARRADGRS